MDKEKIIALYFKDATPFVLTYLDSFLNKIEKFTKEKSLKELCDDRGFVCSLFGHQNASSVSRQTYHLYKRFLEAIFDYYSIEVAIPTIEEVIASQEVVVFFKDLEDILSKIDYVGKRFLDNYSQIEDLPILKACIILGWYGLTKEDIVALDKADVSLIDGMPTVRIASSGTHVTIDELSYKILSALKTSDFYRMIPGGKISYYKSNSKKIIRGASDFEVPPHNIIAIFNRFNNLIKDDYNFRIYFRNLRKNSMFVKIKQDDSAEADSAKIVKYFGCDYSLAVGIKKQYQGWLNLYYK